MKQRTVSRDEDIAANLNKLKVKRILYKPVDMETLVEAVKTVMEEAAKS